MNLQQERLRAIRSTIEEIKKRCKDANNQEGCKKRIAELRAEEHVILKEIGDILQ